MLKKILIIDDSALMRRVMRDIIETDNRLKVEDIAKDGLEGLNLLLKHQYDAVLLDINMPRMDGLELLAELQKNKVKTKIIMVSTLTKEGAKETIIALERGAFDFVTKPENFIEAKGKDFKDRLLKVLLLATSLDEKESKDNEEKETEAYIQARRKERKLLSSKNSMISGSKIVALACSTGGPRSLQVVIPLLPKNMDFAILIVQHMPAGFTASLAWRLNEMSKVHVKEAENGETIKKGWVYIAPGGKHMKVKVDSYENHKILLTDEEPIGGLRPCANLMYQSLKESKYDLILCVILTGMGGDGTEGIRELSAFKNIHVIAQDEATCVVYGMPKTVTEAGLANEIVPLEQISETIMKNVRV